MMLIFEEIQINTSDSVYQKPPPYLPPSRTCIVWDDFQGNKDYKKTERSNDTLISRKGKMLIASCLIWS